MIEESETPGTGPPGRVGDSDFLAERRARRATESGEAALLRRAEAAEATVQTLESHVASLQQRLRDAEEERRRIGELLDAERAHGADRDTELRRVKQREYAEQQLRVEAEDRLSGLERESRERDEQLTRRVAAGEQDSGELGRRIEELRRELSEAEQSAAAERAGLRRAEAELASRVAQLERRAQEIERGLQAERGARERAERELAAIKDGHRRMEGLLGEIRALVKRLAAMLGGLRGAGEAATPKPAPAPPAAATPVAPASPAMPPATPSAPAAAGWRRDEPVSRQGTVAGQQRGLEMADALAAAVERLRARALSAPPLPEDPGEPVPPRSVAPATPLPIDPEAPQPLSAARAPRPPGGPEEAPPAPERPDALRLRPAAGPDGAATAAAGPGERPTAPAGPASGPEPSGELPRAPQAQESAPSYEIPLPAPGLQTPAPAEATPAARPRHKHSQSLMRRIRNRRKERRGG